MSEPGSAARELAGRLIAHEARQGQLAPRSDQAAWRICEQLRLSFAKLVGVAGVRSLLTRALVLATREDAWLARVEITADGALAGLGDLPEQDREAAAQAGLLLVAQFLALLYTFIGESLTLRLVQDVWRDVPLDDRQRERQETPR